MHRSRHSRQSPRAGILLLALLLLRAYVPPGFMPAGGTPFLLELCPSVAHAMPAHHLHHHTGTHADFENCPFGSAPASGPISHHLDFALAGSAPSGPMVWFDSARITLRPQHVHQPRGPPSLA
ncbi:MAG TPA: hypothetical protein VGI65_14660 [Steroidobacteraceae bacterium]